jgi:hypothetical protein
MMPRWLTRGFRWGLMAAGAYSAYVILLYAVGGAGPFESRGVSLPSVIGIYLLGGVMGGPIVSYLQPLARSRVGAMMLGVIAMLPLAGATYLAMATASSEFLLEGVIVTAVLIGAGVGALVWEPPPKQHR